MSNDRDGVGWKGGNREMLNGKIKIKKAFTSDARHFESNVAISISPSSFCFTKYTDLLMK